MANLIKDVREAVRIGRVITLFASIAIGSVTSCSGATSSDLHANVTTLSASTGKIETVTDKLVQDNAKLLKKMRWTNLDQSNLFVVGIATGIVAGQQVKIPINFLLGPDIVSAIQGDILVPAGFTIISVVDGPAAIAAGKSVASSITGQIVRVLVFGLNQNPMFSGTEAVLTLQATATAKKGPNPLMPSNTTASDPDGNEVLLTQTSGLVVLR